MTQTTTRKATTAKRPAAKRTTTRKTAASVPAGAKQPTDRQAPAPADPTKRTVTVDGVDYTISVDVLDDFEVAEALQTGNYLPAIALLFDQETLNGIKEKLRNPDTGRIKYSDVAEFVNKVLSKLNPNS